MLQKKGQTLVRVNRMAPFLNIYPDRPAAHLLWAGFTDGFVMPCSLTQIPPAADNLRSAKLHSEVVSAKLAKEILLGCLCGPFPHPP